MALPTVCAGFTSMAMLLLLFRRTFFSRPSEPSVEAQWIASTVDLVANSDIADAADSDVPRHAPVHVLSAALGAVLLISTLALMFGLSFISVPIWYLGLAFGGVMLAKDLLLDACSAPIRLRAREAPWRSRFCAQFPTSIKCVRRLPPDLIPFMLGMFVLVEALRAQGLLQYVANGLTAALAPVDFNAFATVFLFGTLSTLACSVLNNQPMSILFSALVQLSGLPPSAKRAAMLSVAMGSNFGANLSFVAALAGIMFRAILQPFQVTVTASYFSGSGFAVMPVVLFVGCVLLGGEATLFGTGNSTATVGMT